RTGFGLKGLAWASVELPVIMPKPNLTALTGGYRKTPVLQIGADIYCDSQLIMRELEPVPHSELLSRRPRRSLPAYLVGREHNLSSGWQDGFREETRRRA